MNTTQTAAPDQAALWNGDAGRAWVEGQEMLDLLFRPFEDRLVDAVRVRAARQVLDVGCGTGATTLAIARALGDSGRCVGVDISEPMLGLARARAAREGVPAQFIAADAEAHPFEGAGYDMIVSRFGVMFFADFARAFANLRRAARPGAETRLITWRSPDENPFMTTAERAAAPLLPNLPPRRAGRGSQGSWRRAAGRRSICSGWTWSSLFPRPASISTWRASAPSAASWPRWTRRRAPGW
jgi:SAM-dependent methyltransferase